MMKFAAAVAFAVSLAPSIARGWDVSVEGPDVFGATKALAATTNGREFLVIQCDSDNELYLALTTPKKEFEEVPTVPATFLIQIDSDAPQKLDASTRAWNNNSMGIVVSDRTPELIGVIKKIGGAKQRVNVGYELAGGRDSATFGARGSTKAIEKVVKSCGLE